MESGFLHVSVFLITSKADELVSILVLMESGFLQCSLCHMLKIIQVVSILVLMESGFLHVPYIVERQKKTMFLSLF